METSIILYKTVRLRNQQEPSLNFHERKNRRSYRYIDFFFSQVMQRQKLRARDGTKFRNQWNIGDSILRLTTLL